VDFSADVAKPVVAGVLGLYIAWRAAKRTKTTDFEWTAEACYWLLRSGGVDEEAKSEVAKIVEEVVEELGRSVDK